MRLIDAEKLLRKIKRVATECWLNHVKTNAEGMWNDVQDLINEQPTIDQWHYPSKGEYPDKDWSKHPLNVSKECFVLTKYGIGTIARWDNDYKTWFENQPHLPVPDVVAWQYFEPPKEEA